MIRHLAFIKRAARTLALALAFLILPATLAHAQFPVYSPYAGYGYAYPGFGNAYPGFGYMGYGGYGYPGIGYGYGGGFGYGYGGYGAAGPMFGLGLTPLGTQSALTETAIIRGSGMYGARSSIPVGTSYFYYGAGYR